MKRVSTDMMNNDMQFWLRQTEAKQTAAENKMARQERIENLRDDPVAAGHAVRYASFISRLERFEGNAAKLQDSYKVSESHIRQGVEIMQRVRELAVQGSQNTYSKEDMANMGTEVDELLKELVATANARGPDGTMLFSGDKVNTEPFLATMGNVPGGSGEAIASVDYLGSIQRNRIEVSEGEYIDANLPGNEVFWAEKQMVVADRDARAFQLNADAVIRIDNKDIQLKTGDNAYTVVAKINDSGAAVKASLDPVSGGLMMETTDAHQLMLQDGPESRVFRDLGILKEGSDLPPRNYAPTARVSGGSLFDAVIRLRDSLRSGDVFAIGGQGLAGVDAALGSLERRVAELGSQTERLAMTSARLNREIPDVTAQLAGEKDLDLTQAVIEMKTLERTHQASLQVSGNLFPKTLLDFLQ
jgi:flagellar hook-associated protein 3 FlgL